jgi:hypothetical protein
MGAACTNTPGSVHSPDPALAAATKLRMKWNKVLGITDASTLSYAE